MLYDGGGQCLLLGVLYFFLFPSLFNWEKQVRAAWKKKNNKNLEVGGGETLWSCRLGGQVVYFFNELVLGTE